MTWSTRPTVTARSARGDTEIIIIVRTLDSKRECSFLILDCLGQIRMNDYPVYCPPDFLFLMSGKTQYLCRLSLGFLTSWTYIFVAKKRPVLVSKKDETGWETNYCLSLAVFKKFAFSFDIFFSKCVTYWPTLQMKVLCLFL